MRRFLRWGERKREREGAGERGRRGAREKERKGGERQNARRVGWRYRKTDR